MADTPSRRHPADPEAGVGFRLEAEMLPATGRQDTLHDALRLLTTWAVRAARAQAAAQVPLDCVRPGSDECTPDADQEKT
jgi:hypothetical protein